MIKRIKSYFIDQTTKGGSVIRLTLSSLSKAECEDWANDLKIAYPASKFTVQESQQIAQLKDIIEEVTN